MIRLQLRLVIAVAFVALLAISTGTVLAGPSMQSGSVTLSKTTLAVVEGGGNPTYTVVLDLAPTGDVTIAPSVTGMDVTVNPASLTFTSGNWATTQTVTVSAMVDNMIEGTETHTITHSITETDDATNYPTTLTTIASVTATVHDTDANVTISATTLAVTEGANAAYTVVLGTLPTGAVTVRAISSPAVFVVVGPGIVPTESQTDITFTTTNWNMAQTVTVAAAVDDHIDKGERPWDIFHFVVSSADTTNYPNTGFPIDDARIPVTITDDDIAGVSVSATEVTAAETGATGSYTIVLDTQPPSSVDISVTSENTNNITVEPTSLTFTAGATDNWATPQTVIVTAVNDSFDDDDNMTTITHAVTTGNTQYTTGLFIASVIATATDNDTAGFTIFEGGGVTAVEGGATDFYDIELNSEPTANVVISVTSENTNNITVEPTSLTFTVGAGGNWFANQRVTVTAVDDHVDDDDIASTITHSASSSDAKYNNLSIASVTATATDNDTARVIVSETAVMVSEASVGTTATYTIRLDAQATETVIISVTSGDTNNITVEPTSLTLTIPNSDQTQIVTVTAVNDAVDDGDIMTTITHRITSGDTKYNSSLSIASVIATAEDNDTAGVNIPDVFNTPIVEGGPDRRVVVTLTSKPTHAVMLTFSLNSTSFGVTNRTLTIIPEFWNDTGYVNLITAREDDNAFDESATLTVSVSSTDPKYNDLSDYTRDVRADDNDERGLTFSPTAPTVTEGMDTTYTVVLNSEPTADVRFTVVSERSVDLVVVTPATLDFTSGTWETPQTVTIRGVDDEIDDDNETVNVRHRARASGGDYGDARFTAELSVTIENTDVAAVVIPGVNLTVIEDGTGTYLVKLATEPTTPVTVTLTTTGDINVSPPQLMFNAINWNTFKQVTVTANNDDVDRDMQSAIITHRSAGGEYDDAAPELYTVEITDNDMARVIIPSTVVTADEGSTGLFTIVLETQPVADVTLALTSSQTGDFTVSPTTYTFTPTTWNTSTQFTITGIADVDAIDDTGRIDVGITTTDTKYGALIVADIPVTITDNSVRRLTVQRTTASFAENGGTGSFGVKLNTLPMGDVTVTTTSTPPTIVTVNPNSLTFTTDNWAIEQFFDVTGVNDDIDNENNKREVTITVVPSGADYTNLVDPETNEPVITDLKFTVNDDTDRRGLILDHASGFVTEGEANDAYTLVLRSEPTAQVTITLTINEPALATVISPLTFNFENWNTPQDVSITPTDDDIDTSTDPITFVVTHSVSGGDYERLNSQRFTAGVLDDDVRGITIDSMANVTVIEGGMFDFTVVLNSAPTALVVINVSSTILAAATVDTEIDTLGDQLTLQFTASTWNSPQTVRVSATENDIDHTQNLRTTITYSISADMSGYENVRPNPPNIVVTVTDDIDTRGVTLSSSAPSIVEGGSATYTIKLDSEPLNGMVTVDLTHDHDEVTISPETLTFDRDNWNTVQEVTVSSRADFFDEEDEMVTVRHAIDGADYGGETIPDKEFDLPDDDTRLITVSESMLTIPEAGVGTYTIVLGSAPDGGSVTITPMSASIADVTFMPPSLSFNDSDWNVAQTITVTAVHDRIDEDTYSGADPDTGEMWDITHDVVGADYGAPNNVAASTVAVTVTDNDTRSVTVSPTTLQITEGTSLTYQVKLLSQPTADVTITIAKAAGGEGTLSANPSTLTFTETNWEDSQSVTITAANDNDHASNEQAVFEHAASGGDYTTTPAIMVASVTARTVDTDAANVIISTPSLTASLDFQEGATSTYTIVLTTNPEMATVTVGISVINGSGDNVSDVAISTQMITFTGTVGFTPGNWNTAQTITVTSPADVDAADEMATIDHTVTNYGDAGKPADILVRVSDPQEPGVTVTKDPLIIINEGATGSYTIVLDTQPVGGNVTVTVDNPNIADLLTATTSLTFNATDWNTAKTVTMAPVDDDIDDDGESVILTHTVMGADYPVGLTIDSVTVSIGDNDDLGVTISATTQVLNEEDTSTYTVKLDSQPTAQVTILVESSNTAKVSVESPSTSRLLFTEVNWSNPQTVTLRAVEDKDVEDETETIKHTSSGGDYTGSTTVSVSITDIDMEDIEFTPAILRFVEGGTGVYEIAILTQPMVGQTVTIEITTNSEQVTVNPAEVSFTWEDWNQAKVITVHGDADDDELNDIVTVMHEVRNYGDYVPNAITDVVVVTVREFALLDTLAPLGVPTELTGAVQRGVIILRWRPPVANDDSRVPTSYEYRYTPTVLDDYESPYSSGTRWIRAGGSTTLSLRVSDLINGAEYTFQVRATDARLLAEVGSDENMTTVTEFKVVYEHRTRAC